MSKIVKCAVCGARMRIRDKQKNFRCCSLLQDAESCKVAQGTIRKVDKSSDEKAEKVEKQVEAVEPEKNFIEIVD